MVEMDPVPSSSFPSVTADLNLHLNLGPPFVGELSVVGEEDGFSSSPPPVSRQSWPRFEPQILDGVQEGEEGQDQDREQEEEEEEEEGEEEGEEIRTDEDHISSNFGEEDFHPCEDVVRASELPLLNPNINTAFQQTGGNAGIGNEDDEDDIGASQLQTGVNLYIDAESSNVRASAVNTDINNDGSRASSQRSMNIDTIVNARVGASQQRNVDERIESGDGIRSLRPRNVNVSISDDGIDGIRSLRPRNVNVSISEDGIGASQQGDMNLDIDAADNRTSQQMSLNAEIEGNDHSNADADRDGIRNSERFRDRGGEEGSLSQSSTQTLRVPCYPLRSRHAVFTPSSNAVETHQASTEHVSTDESRVLVTLPSSALPAVSPAFPRIQTPRTQDPNWQIAPLDEPIDEEEEGGRIHGCSRGANFECNICLEMAVEPVVSCCGHLFCWSCIYRWLHLHSSRNECPVCKGFLSDDVITPIYGRGIAEACDRAHGSTPPRPHAHRINGSKVVGFPGRSIDDADNDRLLHGNNQRSTRERVEEVEWPDSSRAERSEADVSSSAELVLNRLRIAQRLQREHLDERLRLRWRRRMMGRRGSAFRSFAALQPLTAQALTSSEDRRQTHHRNVEEDSESNVERGRDLVGASGSHSSSEDERLPSSSGSDSHSSADVGVDRSHSVASEHSATLLPVAATVTLTLSNAIPYAVTLESSEASIGSLTTSTESEDSRGQTSAGESEELWRVWHDRGSGSWDVEAECFHTRKRRRLN